MDIRHLQCVSEIVRLNSFTKAAEALHVTQPTVSKMIKNLESELRIDIFARDGKRIKLTDAGEAMLRHAGPILQSFDDLLTELHDLTYLNKGSIRIGLPPMTGSGFFPAVIKSFQERYPGIAIKVTEDGARKVEEGIAEGMLDVGVVLLPLDEELYDSFPIVDDRLRVVLHPDHKLAGRKRIELAELADEPFLLFNDHFALHELIPRECRAAGFEPHVAFESSQWDFLVESAAAGLGVTLLPETICRSIDPAKARTAELVHPIIPWRPAMAWRRDGYISLAAREWIRFARAAFESARS
ncbi:LysR family transcriptional regulator [Cohnella zeiphila]|uniref:LysR family transcriptional regulator n=1 Tax=Cohnella zeiphila TaxID=2761120 RepID=A0A7X0STT6_9BACL|nr:LysR family transcriptional regulator [Cohnella zeiphila]MBB6736002.1 LysR family transcriptional regulator [Cohnella zeiphila]